MIRYDFEQRGPEWLKARLGIPTSSEFHRIVTPKGELSEQSAAFMHALLAEWALGAPLPSVETEFMQRGAQLEDEAVKAYEFETGIKTEIVGLISSDDGLMACSPDRLAGDDGCLEIKCPAANTHMGHMVQRRLDEKHAPQTQGQLLITERQWVDTVSYYPGLPVVVIRSKRNEEYIATLAIALQAFVQTMQELRGKLVQVYGDFVKRPLVEEFSQLGITDEDVEAILAHQRSNNA